MIGVNEAHYLSKQPRKKPNTFIFRQNVLNPFNFALFHFLFLHVKTSTFHNLSRINTHDKFTREDAVITEMIGSK